MRAITVAESPPDPPDPFELLEETLFPRSLEGISALPARFCLEDLEDGEVMEVAVGADALEVV